MSLEFLSCLADVRRCTSYAQLPTPATAACAALERSGERVADDLLAELEQTVADGLASAEAERSSIARTHLRDVLRRVRKLRDR